MTKAHVSSDDLRQLAKELEKFRSHLEADKARIERLNNSMDWHDKVHEKFTADFTDTMNELKKFLGIIPDHVKHLNKKAQDIDVYGG